MTVWSMEGGVCVCKCVGFRAAPKGEGLETPARQGAVADIYIYICILREITTEK